MTVTPHPIAQVFQLEDEIRTLDLQRARAWTRAEVDLYHRLGHEITNRRLALSEARARTGLMEPRTK